MKDTRWFRNEQPLNLRYGHWDELLNLDFAAFPPINDFVIKLDQTGAFGLHLSFYSPSIGYIAGFPWWDNVEKDLPNYTLKHIPVGDLENPFDDLEQGWQILIFEHQNYVCVLQGDDPCCNEYPTWFRIARDCYYTEWMRIIQQFNPTA